MSLPVARRPERMARKSKSMTRAARPEFAVGESPSPREKAMKCANCGKDIPDGAKMCQFCEARVEPEPTPEEVQVVGEILEQMDPRTHRELEDAFRRSNTADEFVNRIFVGDCPNCAGENTGDCEDDPEIDNILVGRCFDCGQLWCTMCDRLLDKTHPYCECWDEEEQEH